MKLFEQRKGITPVIAIVLLLMVTVGAVGVVYTQFNSLVGNPGEELADQQRDQDTEIRIAQMYTDTDLPDNINSLDHTAANYGTVQLVIQNTGSVSRQVTDFILTAERTAEGSVEDGDCFTEDDMVLDPGDTYECDSGIVYPQVTNNIEFEVLLTDSSKTWLGICRHDRTGHQNC